MLTVADRGGTGDIICEQPLIGGLISLICGLISPTGGIIVKICGLFSIEGGRISLISGLISILIV